VGAALELDQHIGVDQEGHGSPGAPTVARSARTSSAKVLVGGRRARDELSEHLRRHEHAPRGHDDRDRSAIADDFDLLARGHSVEDLGEAARGRPGLAMYGHCVYIWHMARIKERWDFRVASEADQLVRQAAETADRTLTDFVVDAAILEAERVLADRTRFVLETEQWDRFVELLERSPQDKPGLEKLFAKPSVFTTE
jgi:uncharacterized protein (DUF1778 family)